MLHLFLEFRYCNIESTPKSHLFKIIKKITADYADYHKVKFLKICESVALFSLALYDFQWVVKIATDSQIRQGIALSNL